MKTFKSYTDYLFFLKSKFEILIKSEIEIKKFWLWVQAPTKEEIKILKNNGFIFSTKHKACYLPRIFERIIKYNSTLEYMNFSKNN